MGEALNKARELDATYVMHTYGRSKLFVSGKGVHLYDDEGAEYLDFLAGIAVCPLGHADPVVTAAIAEQAGKLLQTSNYFYAENRGEVAQEICRLAGEEHGWKTFFANSGAEANECAMKAARRWAIEHKGPECQTIITLKGSFHGRTMETLAATAQDWLQEPFQPLPVGFRAVPANDCAALDAAMGPDVCAIMMEPIQGESGVWPLGDEYLKHVRELADANNCLVIFDEVQTGLYRCGKPFCFQTVEGVVPDIFTLAKGIASGVPCGACVARGEAAQVLKPGMQGSTFGGGQLAMATCASSWPACPTSPRCAARASWWAPPSTLPMTPTTWWTLSWNATSSPTPATTTSCAFCPRSPSPPPTSTPSFPPSSPSLSAPTLHPRRDR